MSSLQTAVSILDCFGPGRTELAVTDVAKGLKIPKSTVSRLLRAMTQAGLVEQDAESRRYRVGPLPFRLGSLYQAHMQVLDLADAAIGELVEQTGFSGYVGVLSGTDIVILRRRQGRYPVRIVLEPGSRVAAFTTAYGKALLARQSDGELRAALPPVLIYQPTRLKTPIGKFLGELEIVRNRFWAAASEETMLGIGAIGTAVGSGNGEQPVGLSLSFPVNAVTRQQQDEMVEKLVAASARIAAQTGDPVWAARAIAGKAVPRHQTQRPNGTKASTAA